MHASPKNTHTKKKKVQNITKILLKWVSIKSYTFHTILKWASIKLATSKIQTKRVHPTLPCQCITPDQQNTPNSSGFPQFWDITYLPYFCVRWRTRNAPFPGILPLGGAEKKYGDKLVLIKKKKKVLWFPGSVRVGGEGRDAYRSDLLARVGELAG